MRDIATLVKRRLGHALQGTEKVKLNHRDKSVLKSHKHNISAHP